MAVKQNLTGASQWLFKSAPADLVPLSREWRLSGAAVGICRIRYPEWQHDAASLCYNHQGDDCLVDSSGHIFRLEHLRDDSINTKDTGRQITLQDFIRLVRIHASSAHHCCIEKISFRTIADGIELVAGMDN